MGAPDHAALKLILQLLVKACGSSAFLLLSMAVSVTGNFFSRLRSLAVTLEKETQQLEQVFSNEESDLDYEDESPMRVLHDLRSEIKSLKGDIETTVDIFFTKGQEIAAFLKVCKVLQQRTASDVQQVKDAFQKYGYKPLDIGNSESENDDQSPHKSDPEDIPPLPALEKPSTSWDLLHPPQLSDFGLSHYQFPSAWGSLANKVPTKTSLEENATNVLKAPTDILPFNVAKTPKCDLRLEDDFPQIENFGVSDYSTNLNDDYTMALINKKMQKKGNVPENAAKEIHSEEICPSRDLKNILATPAHGSRRADTARVNSPLPPVFCTPGLKVHKKESALFVETLPSKEPPVTDHVATPTVPNFETNWPKSNAAAKPMNVTETMLRLDVSHKLYFEDPAPLVLSADKYSEDPAQISSPPKTREYYIATPPRPEMTISLTEDIFKNHMNPSSPPKMSEYKKLFWTPPRPEMTSCITEDVSQTFSQYCDNKTKPSDMVWGHQKSISSGFGKVNTEHNDKENRLF
ncbi:spindle and kinetochore-associated protein 3 isoform X2 [Ascaphus truei]|uniref:spindle and kinetochore-associated protein 3 isoform X2 n=1 Tax=Ascaphus truei TaxID=8439 RepID=UPI003F5A17F3